MNNSRHSYSVQYVYCIVNLRYRGRPTTIVLHLAYINTSYNPDVIGGIVYIIIINNRKVY